MLRRRTFLKLGAAAMAASAPSAIAAPALYPACPIYLIVGFSAGGNTNIVARVIGEWLTRQMGQPFIVENRTGVATNIATELVAHAPPLQVTSTASSKAQNLPSCQCTHPNGGNAAGGDASALT